MHDGNALQAYLSTSMPRCRSRTLGPKVSGKMHAVLLGWTSLPKALLSGLPSLFDQSF